MGAFDPAAAAAFDANEVVAREAERGGSQVLESDFASIELQAIALDLGISREEINALMEVCLKAAYDDKSADPQVIRTNPLPAALAVGMISGYLAARREAEADRTTTEPTTPVRGYLSDGGALLAGLVKFAAENEGSLGMGWGTATKEWSVSLTFGREAEDSPMAGGQALGLAPSLQEALEQVAEEAHIEPVPLEPSALAGEVPEPPYPAELLDDLAKALALRVAGEDREIADLLDRYSAEVGREQCADVIWQAMSRASGS